MLSDLGFDVGGVRMGGEGGMGGMGEVGGVGGGSESELDVLATLEGCSSPSKSLSSFFLLLFDVSFVSSVESSSVIGVSMKLCLCFLQQRAHTGNRDERSPSLLLLIGQQAGHMPLVQMKQAAPMSKASGL